MMAERASWNRAIRQAPVIEPIQPQLLRSPVDFLFAEHYRQRVVLNHLERAAADPAMPDRARVVKAILEYLRRDLPYHVQDEERDLFPLMRKRCLAKDRIDAVFRILSAEHAGDDELADLLIDALEQRRGSGDQAPAIALERVAHAFAETQRRHLVWENTLVLPLARQRLTDPDLVRLGRKMAARRSIPFPKSTAAGRALSAFRSVLRG